MVASHSEHLGRDSPSAPKFRMLLTVLDALKLLFRHPLLLLPFLFAWMVVESGIMKSLNVPTNSQSLSLLLPALQQTVAVVVLMVLAGHITSTLAAWTQFEHKTDMASALVKSLRRFPSLVVLAVGVSAMNSTVAWVAWVERDTDVTVPIVFALVLLGGFCVYLVIRWMLVPPFIILGGTKVIEAFKMSWGVTKGHSWALFILALLVTQAGGYIWGIVILLLRPVPWTAISTSGLILESVESAWMSVALTLVYKRLGGRIRPQGDVP